MVIRRRTFGGQAWIGVLLLLPLAGCGGGSTPALAPAPPPSVVTPPTPPSSGSAPDNLYTMSNLVSGNTVISYTRNADGALTQSGSVATGGSGVGHGLENQGALAVSDDGKFLLVVNAGSNDVSALQITSQGLNLTARASSGGRLPISVTSRGSLVYVLNRGGEAGDPNGDNISGLRLAADGSLTPIQGSTSPLSAANTNPAQIEFNPGGSVIVVTEHGGGKIDTYTVDANGSLCKPSALPCQRARQQLAGLPSLLMAKKLMSPTLPVGPFRTSVSARTGVSLCRNLSLPQLRAGRWIWQSPRMAAF